MLNHRKPHADAGNRDLSGINRAVLLLGMFACGPAFAGGDEVFVSSFEDGEASAANWKVLEWPMPVNYAECTTVRVYGVVAGDHFTVTTCVPPGHNVGTGDSVIESVFDNQGNDYAVINDDCTPELVPHISDWNCANNEAEVVMSCGPLDAVGIEVLPGAYRLDVRICPFSESPGSSPLHILWQGNSTPNPG